MRFFSDRMASFEATALDRITSEISRLAAMSSLSDVSISFGREKEMLAYSELDVAFSTCSSNWEDDANQPAIMLDARHRDVLHCV